MLTRYPEYYGLQEYLRPSTSWRTASIVAQLIKNLPAMQETWVWFLVREDAMEKEMATHFQYSCLENPIDRGAWHATVHSVPKSLTQLTFRKFRRHGFDPWVRKIWRRRWQPTPVFLTWKSHGQRSLVGTVTRSQTWLSDWAYMYMNNCMLFIWANY